MFKKVMSQLLDQQVFIFNEVSSNVQLLVRPMAPCDEEKSEAGNKIHAVQRLVRPMAPCDEARV